MTKCVAKKNSIHAAVLNSLDDLVRSGEKITQTAVIAGAIRENGKPIGKTALYTRNSATKELVHADLIKKIDQAAAQQRKKSGRKTKSETIQGVKSELKAMRKQNQDLINEIVLQQDKIRVLSLSEGRERNLIARGEDDVFVLSMVLNEITQGALGDVKTLIAQYMDKHAGTDRLELAKLSVKRYLTALEKSRLATLKQPETPKNIAHKLNQ